jgi:hypothetical protein
VEQFVSPLPVVIFERGVWLSAIIDAQVVASAIVQVVKQTVKVDLWLLVTWLKR